MAKLKALLHAPFPLHIELLKLIEQEIDCAKFRSIYLEFVVKVNALTEPQLIAALYRASQAVCRVPFNRTFNLLLDPQVKDLSENIHVRSVVGHFLEHTRVYYFEQGGEKRLFCASADWMGVTYFLG